MAPGRLLGIRRIRPGYRGVAPRLRRSWGGSGQGSGSPRLRRERPRLATKAQEGATKARPTKAQEGATKARPTKAQEGATKAQGATARIVQGLPPRFSGQGSPPRIRAERPKGSPRQSSRGSDQGSGGQGSHCPKLAAKVQRPKLATKAQRPRLSGHRGSRGGHGLEGIALISQGSPPRLSSQARHQCSGAKACSRGSAAPPPSSSGQRIRPGYRGAPPRRRSAGEGVTKARFPKAGEATKVRHQGSAAKAHRHQGSPPRFATEVRRQGSPPRLPTKAQRPRLATEAQGSCHPGSAAKARH